MLHPIDSVWLCPHCHLSQGIFKFALGFYHWLTFKNIFGYLLFTKMCIFSGGGTSTLETSAKPYLCIYTYLMASLEEIFPVVIYGCERWIVKKTRCQRIDVFELWCWRRLMKVSWTARRSNQSVLRNQPWIFTGRTYAEA